MSVATSQTRSVATSQTRSVAASQIRSVAAPQAETPTVTAPKLLAYSRQRLVNWVRSSAATDENLRFLARVKDWEQLSKKDLDHLWDRIFDAFDRPQQPSLPFAVDDLIARLQQVADRQDGSPDVKPLSSPSGSISSETGSKSDKSDLAYRQGLIEAGGRPVCSIEELNHIRAEPMARFKAILSWVTDEPDSEVGRAGLSTVFTRQFNRWWVFRMSQWHSRGQGDNEAGISAYIESNRSIFTTMGRKALVSAPSFDEDRRREWQTSSILREPPECETFSAYNNTVKKRLAPHSFTKPLMLRKNPQKESAWTEWLEYVSFEIWCLERLTAGAESRDLEFLQSTRKLVNAEQLNGNNSINSTELGDRGQGGKGPGKAKESEAARADRDASQLSIDSFIRETEPYRQFRRRAFYQRHRVDWAIKEARLMEAEISRQRNATKSKKRKQRDEKSPETSHRRNPCYNARQATFEH